MNGALIKNWWKIQYFQARNQWKKHNSVYNIGNNQENSRTAYLKKRLKEWDKNTHIMETLLLIFDINQIQIHVWRSKYMIKTHTQMEPQRSNSSWRKTDKNMNITSIQPIYYWIARFKPAHFRISAHRITIRVCVCVRVNGFLWQTSNPTL